VTLNTLAGILLQAQLLPVLVVQQAHPVTVLVGVLVVRPLITAGREAAVQTVVLVAAARLQEQTALAVLGQTVGAVAAMAWWGVDLRHKTALLALNGILRTVLVVAVVVAAAHCSGLTLAVMAVPTAAAVALVHYQRTWVVK
jgi:uncharacterized membrane protein YsdA (DUF1294 family)